MIDDSWNTVFHSPYRPVRVQNPQEVAKQIRLHLNKTNLYTSLSIKCSGSARPLLQDELQAGEGGTRYYFDLTVHVFRQYFLKDINTVALAAANIKLTEIVTYIM